MKLEYHYLNLLWFKVDILLPNSDFFFISSDRNMKWVSQGILGWDWRQRVSGDRPVRGGLSVPTSVWHRRPNWYIGPLDLPRVPCSNLIIDLLTTSESKNRVLWFRSDRIITFLDGRLLNDDDWDFLLSLWFYLRITNSSDDSRIAIIIITCKRTNDTWSVISSRNVRSIVKREWYWETSFMIIMG